MCIAVYLASDEPLALVPWDDGHPAFWVGELSPGESVVRVQFGKPHVVYAGSHEGCSCGFQYGRWPADSYEPDELARGRESLGAFADYLDAQLECAGEIQLYACWEGDQEAQPEHRRDLKPEDFRRNDFFLIEKELSVIRKR